MAPGMWPRRTRAVSREVSDDRLDTGGGHTGGVRLWTAGLSFGL